MKSKLKGLQRASQAEDGSNTAYVTMLTDDSYLAGVQVLSYTLRKAGKSARPLIVLVSKDSSKVHRATII